MFETAEVIIPASSAWQISIFFYSLFEINYLPTSIIKNNNIVKTVYEWFFTSIVKNIDCTPWRCFIYAFDTAICYFLCIKRDYKYVFFHISNGIIIISNFTNILIY